MTTSFEKREQGYENKYAHEKEAEFKIAARANYLLGIWASDKVQLKGRAAEDFAQEFVEFGVQKNSEEAIIEHVIEELKKSNIEISEEEIKEELQNSLETARNEASGNN